jgi:hypothetical protein
MSLYEINSVSMVDVCDVCTDVLLWWLGHSLKMLGLEKDMREGVRLRHDSEHCVRVIDLEIEMLRRRIDGIRVELALRGYDGEMDNTASVPVSISG